MQIGFSEIPGFSNLFLDYLYEFENCGDFFKKYFRNSDKFEEQFRNRITPDNTLRVKLRSIISGQYSLRAPSKLTIQNINSIENENTIAVITEIQPYLFGGPLSAVYKIISAIKLAQKLKEDFDEYNFVPVLWIESENSNFDEITSFYYKNKDGLFSDLRYGSTGDEADESTFKELIFNSEISELANVLFQNLPQTNFTEQTLKRLLQSYKTGATFTEAFSEFAYKLFDEYGLVIFNPSEIEVKKLLAPIFRQELINFREHAEKLVESTAELDDLYGADEKLVPLNLYLTIDNQKLLIEPVENQFRLHTKRKRITEEELLRILKDEPEKITPATLLVPICQNYLFQTGFRIANGDEISRLAQSEQLYDFFDIEPPFIYPAISATLLDEKSLKYINENDISFQTVFLNDSDVGNIDAVNQSNAIDELFNMAKVGIAEKLAELEEQLNLTDNDSDDEVRNTAKEISLLLENLRDKIKLSRRMKEQKLNSQLEEIKNAVFPHEVLQEKRFATVAFINKYGEDFIKILFNKLNVAKTDHQIIEI